MRRFIAASCCVIVGVQVLVGVPLAVCIAFFMHFGSDLLGPTSVEFRVSNSVQHPAVPETSSESAARPNEADAILEARGQRSSLLAGTVLGENLSPADEQREFVAAFRQVAEEAHQELPESGLAAGPAPVNLLPGPAATEMAVETAPGLVQASADRFAIEHLYLMADRDEQAGFFARSDQWRELARAIRGPSPAAVKGGSAANDHCPLEAEAQ